jgi:hypothetical protein
MKYVKLAGAGLLRIESEAQTFEALELHSPRTTAFTPNEVHHAGKALFV